MNQKMLGRILAAAGLLVILLSADAALAQTTTFIYQGRLSDAGSAANGNYDLQFALFDSLSGGTQIGSTQAINTVAVSNGVFTVSLDFGASSFSGANRFLEIRARPSNSGSFILLTPRQQVTSTPYAVRSANASAADALSGLCSGCVTDTNITTVAGSKITGTIPVNGVPAGSGNYIQNTASQQSSTNFNITGNGTAGGTLSGGIVNAATQYNIGGNRALSIAGTNNTFAGIGAGSANATGGNNSFFGLNAGSLNTTGSSNNFFGHNAGSHNTTAGSNNFFGSTAGLNNSTGAQNSFFGGGAGLGNTTGNSNTMLGSGADVGSGNLSNATAIGANAVVTQSNSLVLGSINGVNGATATTDVGIGTTAPQARLDVITTGLSNAAVRATNTFGDALIAISNAGGGVGVTAFGPVGLLVQATDSNPTTNIVEGWTGSALNDPTRFQRFHITGQGTYVAGSDFAEAMPARGNRDRYEPGDVLVVSTQSAGAVEKSSKPNDVCVAGVYSTRPGMLGADKSGTSRVDPDDLPVAIVGIVPTKVSTQNGPIQVGDLLTTSSTPGYAMKATPFRVGRVKVYRTGTILGKALEPLKEGKGVIKVLVTLR